MARVRHTAKAIEGEGSPSNHEDRPASPEATEAAAASSSSSSSLESGKISDLDGTASSRESGSSTSSLNSDASSDSDSEGDVEIMLSDTDAKKRATDIEEGDIGEGNGVTAAEESRENLAGVNAGPQDLVKPSTCFLGRSLMTQADLVVMVWEGCFASGTCRLPGRETTPKPKKNESVVFRDYFTAGLRLPVSKRFVDILAAYKVQIHQLTPNSFPQIMKFLWACRTFVGDNDVETFIRHFEIHWAKRIITVDDEDKEAQYGCCTFQTRRVNKNQAPVELAHAYKNK
jgi:hypothetical protein